MRGRRRQRQMSRASRAIWASSRDSCPGRQAACPLRLAGGCHGSAGRGAGRLPGGQMSPLKVLQAPGSPPSSPRRSQRIRCSALPWVNDSGLTRRPPSAAAGRRRSGPPPGSPPPGRRRRGGWCVPAGRCCPYARVAVGLQLGAHRQLVLPARLLAPRRRPPGRWCRGSAGRGGRPRGPPRRPGRSRPAPPGRGAGRRRRRGSRYTGRSAGQ